jgi:7-cyano-7-deazaguanine synthase in queuosine biosynthesis
MKITYDGITLDFFDLDIIKNDLIIHPTIWEDKEYGVKLSKEGLPERVVVSVSGGCDSASALYLCCKHFPQIDWIPYTARDLNAPKDADAAILIVEKLQKEFPNANLRDIRVFEFDDRDPRSWVDADWAIANMERYKDMTTIGMSKVIQIDRITENLMIEYDYPLRLDGMSSNPSIEEMIKGGFNHTAEPRRNHEANWATMRSTIYQPFINVDKRFVAGIFKESDFLLNEIYPHTRSCTGTARTTNNFTRVCGTCFWCHERNWAFGDELYPMSKS